MADFSSTHTHARLTSIDQLRGTVMLVMLLDHVRETFYLHQQLSDPVDVEHVDPALFACRLLAHLCAPVFVLLTGLSAWLYGSAQIGTSVAGAAQASAHVARRATALFLAKRGAFLVLLELTLVNTAWTFEFPPQTLYLQVIWAIGLSMLSLSLLLWLPRAALVAVAAVIVGGHNLLDAVHVDTASPWHTLWAIAHQRDWLQLGDGLRARTSYPLLPWIGVMALGYAMGPWFERGADAVTRQRYLLWSGLAAIAGFAALRALNIYGDAPWQHLDTPLRTLMSVVNITKYPPSLLFVLLTLGVGLLLLRLYEQPRVAALLSPLARIGAAPMFFYLLHLYVLRLLYIAAEGIWGHNQGSYFGFDGIAPVLLTSAVLAVSLYWPTHWFAGVKARRRDLAWLRYL